MRRPTVALLALIAGACLADRSAPVAERPVAGPVLGHQEQTPRMYAFAQTDAGVRLDSSGAGRAARATVPGFPGRMLIRSGAVSLRVDSLEPAVALLERLAARLGGHLANAAIQAGPDQPRSARVQLKVPAERFDEAIAGLRPIGKLESTTTNTQDVGEEYVDVNARLTNGRRLEQRLLGLLATRTGKLTDVLEVEQQLARVREEIERYEGRLRYLRAQVAMSAIVVDVHEPVPVVGRVGSGVMGEAVKQGWRNFVGFVAFLVQALGIAIPLGALAGGGWLVAQRLRA